MRHLSYLRNEQFSGEYFFRIHKTTCTWIAFCLLVHADPSPHAPLAHGARVPFRAPCAWTLSVNVWLLKQMFAAAVVCGIRCALQC